MVLQTTDEPEAAPVIVHVPAVVGENLSNVSVDIRKDPLVDVFNLLKGEAAPLQYWIQIALAYYNHGMLDQYEQVMKEACDNMNFLPTDANTNDNQMAILNSLCAYYTNAISAARRKKASEQQTNHYWELVQKHNAEAMHKDPFNATAFAVKAFAFMATGKEEKRTSAQQLFDMALKELDNKNVPCLLGKAVMCYNDKQYHQALEWYSKALKANPQCPGFVRLGMAYCWYRLKEHEKAKLCFQRVVDMEPENVTALVGLALLDLDIQNKDSFERSVTYLKQAFKLQGNHPMVFNTFADHFFHNQFLLNKGLKERGEQPGSFREAEDLARKASECAENPQIKALAWFQIGRCRHAAGDLNEALKYYFQAANTSGQLPLAQYSLGQMYVWKGQLEDAIKELQQVLNHSPEDRDTLMALGRLYLQLGKDVEASGVLKKVTDQYKDNEEAWLLYGYSSRHDSEFALKCMANAIRAAKTRDHEVQHSTWNNVGVLNHVAGYLDDAMRLYLKALTTAGGDLEHYELEQVLIVMNIARLKEDMGQYEESSEVLRGIVRRFPSYVDPLLGLARICLRKHDKNQAAQWLEVAMEVDKTRPEPWLMLADTYSGQKEFIRAQDKYEHVLKSINTGDAHAQLGMGFIYLNALQTCTLPDKEEKYSKLALDYYQKVLQNDQSNIYAAHGLGCYMAFKGHYDEARRCLARVSQATFTTKEDTCFTTMLVNYANAHCMVGNYSQASKMYQNIIKRYPSSISKHQLHALLGQSLFFNGDYEQCLEVLSKALRDAPHNQRLWFNLALVQMLLALKQLQALEPGKPEKIRVSHYDKAKSTQRLFGLALRNFERVKLHYDKYPNHPLYRATKENIGVVQAHLSNAEICADRATKVKAQTEAKVARFRIEQAKREKARQREVEEEARRKREKEEQLRRMVEEQEKRREELRLRFAQQEEAMALEEQRKKAAGPRGKKREEAGPGGDEYGEAPGLQQQEEEEAGAEMEDDSDDGEDYEGEEGEEGGERRKKHRDKKERKKDKKDKKEKKDKKDKKEKKHKKDKEHRKHRHRDEGETDAAPQAEGAAMEQVVPEPPEGTGAADMEEDGAGAEGKQTPEERARRKEEKRRRKEQKAAEKAQRKEEKKRKRAQDGADDDDDALGDMLDGDVAQDDGEGAAPAKKKTRVVDDDDDDGLFE